MYHLFEEIGTKRIVLLRSSDSVMWTADCKSDNPIGLEEARAILKVLNGGPRDEDMPKFIMKSVNGYVWFESIGVELAWTCQANGDVVSRLVNTYEVVNKLNGRDVK